VPKNRTKLRKIHTLAITYPTLTLRNIPPRAIEMVRVQIFSTVRMKVFGRFQSLPSCAFGRWKATTFDSTRGSDLDEDMGDCGDREVVFELPRSLFFENR
jgi:hypothetical protein